MPLEFAALEALELPLAVYGRSPKITCDMVHILSWGGIGDTLHNIGVVPHQFLYETFGYRCRVVRRPHLPGEIECPSTAFFQDLIGRSPSLQFAGESFNPPQSRRLITRALREVVKFGNGGVARYFPYNFRLTEAEQNELPRRAPGRTIAVQTHFAGIGEKTWGVANWKHYLDALLSSVADVSVVLIDNHASVEELCTTPRITSHSRFNISQSIALVRQAGFLVSIDSWSKYVAASENIPQVVVVPSQSEHHSPEYLARQSFEGIFGHPRNILLGLEGTRRHPRTTLLELGNLDPLYLADATMRLLAQHTK